MAVRRGGLRELRIGAWLGWQIDANWTNPYLFTVYALARPLASALILIFMYVVITGGQENLPVLAFIIVGNALWAFVNNGLQELSWAILDDRERYQMLKYIYMSPVSVGAFILGRSATKLVAGGLSAAIILTFGVVVFKIPVALASIDVPLLLAGLWLGWVSICAIGMALSSVTLALGRHAYGMSEGFSGALYLLSGAIFPLSVLPGWLQVVSRIIPLTYWLEAIRRALLGAQYSSSLASLSDGELLLWLLGLTAGMVMLSVLLFRTMEHLAKERGLIDMLTGY